jgi:hypothetical protein
VTARKSASALLVPTTPTDPNHATSKSYVDSSISSATSGVNVAMDHVTGLVAALGGKMDKSVIDAKGEIVAGTAANSPGIVAVPGADGQFLKSAAASSATGLIWAALTATDVGLGNVNNTSDSAKNSAAVALTNKDLTSATNTFPTFNQSTTGNAATATKLATARAINGVSFDGTAAITINAVDATAREPAIAAGSTSQYYRGDKSWQNLTQDAVPDGTTNKAFTSADQIHLFSVATGATANSSDAVLLARANHTGTQLAATISDFNTAADARVAAGITGKENAIAAGTTGQYWRGDKSWQTLNAAAVGLGSVNNTADASKSVASAATLTTPRAINGVNFDGSAAITINAVDATAREPAIAAGTTAQYWRGDKSWQALSGIAAGTAATLATPRAINGVNFDGSAAITVADATKLPLAGGTLTGLLTLSGAPTSALHAATKTYVDNLTSRAWAPEANICQGTLAVGYNDLPGGFAVEPGPNATGVTLQAVWIRMGTIGATFAASSVFDVYVGTATTQGTLTASITMAAASTNQVSTLGTPVSMAANAVVRVYCSTAGASVTGPIHAQLRGVYNG